MNVILIPQQKLAISEVMRALDGTACNADNLGVLLVGSPGVGTSTCINEVKTITKRKFIDLKAIDFQSVGCLGRWLGNILGLDDVRISMKIKVSTPVVSMLNVMGVSMLILEDAHDVNSSGTGSNALYRIIEEFDRIKSAMPKIKLLLTVEAAELPSMKLSEAYLSKMFTVINISPITFDNLVFLVKKIYLSEPAGSPLPALSDRVLMAIFRFSKGSVGRAIFILELIKHDLASGGLQKKNDAGIIQFISRFEG
ncbi:hypothetical protein [Pseudomonas fluorescens]|jgi:replication-associated recombination protein RarA|uniref:AAA+ ATPase domain-containing protein n=1 Tax=Pseudomonas fluorescens TaxID=294 RepID=A0A5E7IG05_PSEFL|nr:hypothetical protein [Pseudomonas fluorescens]VVO74836.1 hypothetical protein PS880_01496 [Pseudomonas fluorescens]